MNATTPDQPTTATQPTTPTAPTPLDALYVPAAADYADFTHYRPPEAFRHGDWHPVACYEPTCEDGLRAWVLECRMPARFFLIDATDPKTSRLVLRLQTGSGEQRLAACIADAFARGALGVASEDDDAQA